MSIWVFIPESKEASMCLQNEIPIGEGSPVVGDILFNSNLESPGVGIITDSALGEVSFNFQHNEWFMIIMNWNISGGDIRRYLAILCRWCKCASLWNSFYKW